MDELTTTQGIVALGAAGVALLALLLVVVVAIRLRRVRASQRVVLGEHRQRDLVAHAARLEEGFVALRDWLEETAARLDERMSGAEQRLDGCVTYRSVIRYDAYGEMSGRQSSTVALLDSRRSGVVLSSILHRDQARVYLKQIEQGESQIELSPEEQAAVDAALAGEPQAAAPGAVAGA